MKASPATPRQRDRGEVERAQFRRRQGLFRQPIEPKGD
jgi:hypothetical protein